MSKSTQFEKFINKKSNAAIKEQFKQEKKSLKKEKAAAIEKFYEEKRVRKAGGESPAAHGPKASKTYDRKAAPPGPDNSQRGDAAKGKRDYGAANTKRGNSKTQTAHTDKRNTAAKGETFQKRAASAKTTPLRKPDNREVTAPGANPQTPEQPLKYRDIQAAKYTKKPKLPAAEPRERSASPGNAAKRSPTPAKREAGTFEDDQQSKLRQAPPSGPQMPLNKYLAHSGISARREAAEIVKEGKVQVNGKVVLEPGFKVSESDVVKVSGKKISPTREFVYILLNKPKDFITTTDDPQGRKTVLELIRHATTERVYPVGRLDRNTSGVLLITNDGDLAQKLSHPSNEVKKIYEVRLDKPLTKADFDKILNGITLEDGFIAPDALAYTDPKDRTIIGIEIHSGRNRIVRRIFESLQYDVRGLDRVTYAGLTKKNVLRGKWRLLNEREVRILKHFNK